MPDPDVRVSITYGTLTSVCERTGCDRTIEQPDRPGRKRRFCSDRCRQAAFRMRKKQPDEKTAAWLRAIEERTK